MRRKTLLAILIAVIIVGIFFSFITSSNSTFFDDKPKEAAIPDSVLFHSAPVLSPEQALQTFQIEEGFAVELVASEPLIEDPVAMDFDEMGRMWVVEMPSYMPDIMGHGEDQKTGRVVILEDEDEDGLMDKAKVFTENLVLPRAVAIVKGGVLIAEPPNLWFVERNGDEAGKKILVDTAYAVGGNVEHQPNGLLRGMDNWIYSAKSSARYQQRGDKWIKENTEFRGQWGITQDDFGRLYYNTNSNQLRGDLVPPNTIVRNPNLSGKESVNREIAADQKTYPIRPTPGVNRGYKDETLDDQKRLATFTAACGPLVYRGDQFPAKYYQNAFVCEPSGNLVKRNLLKQSGAYMIGEQAYENKEFLASTDERFRPVSLYNGPDGNMYLVDMYRGIIQHETYLTDYLKDQIKQRGLDKPIGLGRIYRIVHKGDWTDKLKRTFTSPDKPNMDEASDEELVAMLSNKNGWWRDMAQRKLIDHNNKEIVPLLHETVTEGNDLAKMHALWVLNGMNIQDEAMLKAGLNDDNPNVVATAVQVAGSYADTQLATSILEDLQGLVATNDSLIRLELAVTLGNFLQTDSLAVLKSLTGLAIASGDDPVMNEALVSSVTGAEGNFLTALAPNAEADPSLVELLNRVITNANLKSRLLAKDFNKEEKARFLLGKSIFEKTCAGCHQENGEGLVPIAPPLVNSEWVLGAEERLIRIILHGLKGPVNVAGKLYKEPEVQPVMPGLKDNPMFDDEKLAAVLTYIRNGWTNDASVVDANKVKEIRESELTRTEPFTEKELLNIYP